MLNHNTETVPRLYRRVRPKARYRRSLELIRRVKEIDPAMTTKSGIMVGLGETLDEVRAVLDDLREHGCDLLTVGQYLRPSLKHLPIERFWHPDEFAEIADYAHAIGFTPRRVRPAGAQLLPRRRAGRRGDTARLTSRSRLPRRRGSESHIAATIEAMPTEPRHSHLRPAARPTATARTSRPPRARRSRPSSTRSRPRSGGSRCTTSSTAAGRSASRSCWRTCRSPPRRSARWRSCRSPRARRT